MIDLIEKKIIDNEEIKEKYATKNNYESHLKKNQIFIDDIKKKDISKNIDSNQLTLYQTAFGYTKEDISFFLNPILKSGIEPTGSMGTDTPISLLCDKTKLLYSYFKQCFAQVTNPPIDPIREELVMSLKMSLGSKPNIFSTPDQNNFLRLELDQPILSNDDLQSIVNLKDLTNGKLKTSKVDILFKNSNSGNELQEGIDKILSLIHI